MPIVLNLILLSGSLIFIIWYFIIYPVRLSKKFSIQLNAEEV